MNLVLFDFDSTITTLDTTLPFGVFLAGKCSSRHRIPLLVAALLLAKLRLVSNTGLKQLFARLLLRGQSLERIRKLTLEFHDTCLNTLIDDGILQALRDHVSNGDCVYLVSANFDFFLHPLVERWALAGMIATETENHSGVFTGRIVGAACHGHEKVRRVIDRCGAGHWGETTAYGNQDDSPLLDAAQTSYLIRRAKPQFPLGLWRRYFHILSGKPHRAEPSTAPQIDPFRSSRSARPYNDT